MSARARPRSRKRRRDAAVKTFQREVQLRTAGGLTVTDITDEVRDAVRESGIQDGICCVYSPHTTCSVRDQRVGARLPRGLRGDAQAARADGALLRARRLGPPHRERRARRTWSSATATRTACRCCSARPASRCRCARASCASAPGSAILFLELDRERDRRWLVQVVGVSRSALSPRRSRTRSVRPAEVEPAYRPSSRCLDLVEQLDARCEFLARADDVVDQQADDGPVGRRARSAPR